MKQKSTALCLWSVMCLVSLGATGFVAPAQAQSKPNIVVIWGDDIGGEKSNEIGGLLQSAQCHRS